MVEETKNGSKVMLTLQRNLGEYEITLQSGGRTSRQAREDMDFLIRRLGMIERRLQGSPEDLVKHRPSGLG